MAADCENVPTNSAPTNVALSDSTIAENEPAGATVGTLSSIDPDVSDTHTFALVPGTGDSGNGSFAITGSTLRTDAVFDFETRDSYSIRVRATDTHGASRAEQITITVDDVVENVDPVAVDDTFATVEDTALDLPVSGVGSPAANDTDADGDPLTVTSVDAASGGTVSIAGGQITFAPDLNLCAAGAGGFDYRVSDGNGGTDTGHVSVDITCVEDAPVAVDDTTTVDEDDAATAVDVLANDTDVDGDPISITSVTQPDNGTVAITGGGTGLTYAPDADYCNDPAAPGPTAPDTFTYTLDGGSSATVSVTVTCVDDPPTAVDDSATVAEDDAASPVDVQANDTDVDGGAISIDSVTQPDNGTVVITGAGTGLSYAPDANYCNTHAGGAPDTFTYTLTPGTSTGAVAVTVTCGDDPPVAVDDAATVAEDSAPNPVHVLANDTDVDGGPRAVGAVTQPDNGTVAITGGGTGLTYAPDAVYCNTSPGATPDTFSYTLNGGDSATVSLTVTCVQDPPVAMDDTATVLEDAVASAVDVLANDTDVDSGPSASPRSPSRTTAPWSSPAPAAA